MHLEYLILTRSPFREIERKSDRWIVLCGVCVSEFECERERVKRERERERESVFVCTYVRLCMSVRTMFVTRNVEEEFIYLIAQKNSALYFVLVGC